MEELFLYNTCKILSYLWIIFFKSINATEYCNGDVFEATCAANEVVVMDRAEYGRMKIGRCVANDRGYLGCHNDAIQALDKQCSGEQSCQMTISNKLWRDEVGSCEDHLVGYAELDYQCYKIHHLESSHCHGEDIKISSEIARLSSNSINALCGPSGSIKVAVEMGQHLNISVLNFKPHARRSLGTIRDKTSNNHAEISSELREKHLMTSVGNIIEIDLLRPKSDNIGFILEFQVLGCPNISPPDGAWMIRDGDVIEIGCHAGTKSWSLKCEYNKWIGVLGYCGTDEQKDNAIEEQETTAVWSVSLNVLVFGVCSLVILLSACIFLAGVVILKRKLTPSKAYAPDQGTLPLMGHTAPGYDWSQNTASKTQPFFTATNPSDDRSFKIPYTDTTSMGNKGISGRVTADYSAQSERSGDSVKYYVLEDATHEPIQA